MKILSRYVLREHLGPLTFALTALTSLMLLNFISRQFGELVGKGLSWAVIGEFFLLSVPFTVALTVPMSVLVSVLYAFSRLASENEVIALKANGVSPWRLVSPAIGGGVVMSLGLLAFNDQVLPPANHRLKTLQEDISQTKPTFLLKEQVINPIAEGKFYLKAGKIDRSGGVMREVVIYDLADASKRKTIYADSGTLKVIGTDLDMNLFHGQMQEVSTDKPSQMNRLFYLQDRIRIKDVARGFKQTQSDSTSKGDREMSVCEMQRRLWQADGGYQAARRDYDAAKAEKTAFARRRKASDEDGTSAGPQVGRTPEPRGIGYLYCRAMKSLGITEAWAMAPPSRADTVPRKDSVTRRDTTTARDTSQRAAMRRDSSARVARAKHDSAITKDPAKDSANGRASGMFLRRGQVPPAASGMTVLSRADGQRTPVPAVDSVKRAPAQPPVNAAAAMRAINAVSTDPKLMIDSRMTEAKLRLDLATRSRNRYEIEIHKKFSLAAACLIFVIVGAPIAVRFPRGGVGLVIGVSLLVFALYYVGLIGGESLANEGIVPPFWAMWGTNVILTSVGIVMLFRMGKDQNTGRGGGLSDWIDNLLAKYAARRAEPAA